MATVSRTYMTDDLDGSEASETVRFNAEGVELEIDLSAENATRLRNNLQRFIDAATPVKAKSAPAKRTRGKAAAVKTNRELVGEIRRWADEVGIAVSSRGRLSSDLVDKYNAAH